MEQRYYCYELEYCGGGGWECDWWYSYVRGRDCDVLYD